MVWGKSRLNNHTNAVLLQVPAVLTWTCDDVCRFLKSIGLEKYTPEFSINRMDGCKLLQLDGSKLKVRPFLQPRLWRIEHALVSF